MQDNSSVFVIYMNGVDELSEPLAVVASEEEAKVFCAKGSMLEYASFEIGDATELNPYIAQRPSTDVDDLSFNVNLWRSKILQSFAAPYMFENKYEVKYFPHEDSVETDR